MITSKRNFEKTAKPRKGNNWNEDYRKSLTHPKERLHNERIRMMKRNWEV